MLLYFKQRFRMSVASIKIRPPYKNITYIAYRNMLYFNHPLLISRH